MASISVVSRTRRCSRASALASVVLCLLPLLAPAPGLAPPRGICVENQKFSASLARQIPCVERHQRFIRGSTHCLLVYPPCRIRLPWIEAQGFCSRAQRGLNSLSTRLEVRRLNAAPFFYES